MSKNILKTAVIQINSGEDKEKNLNKSKKFIKEAVKKGAKFITLPEVFNYRGNLLETAKQAEKIPGLSSKYISELAKKHKVWILIGSMMELPAGSTNKNKKPFNTSVLINPQGKVTAKYRKIHLFDIKLKGQMILESSRNQPGKTPTLTKVGKTKVGLSICYDIRFPEMYRKYADKGAEIICIPSSFTKPTGEAHWHTLNRSRAIENQCFIIAPNQAGTGSGGVKTYGHSLIIDPWGKILAEAPASKETVIYADLDMDHLRKIRRNLPALEHRRI